MNKNEPIYCEACGAKVTKYKVQVNKRLAIALIKLRRLEIYLNKRHVWLEHDDAGTAFEFTRNERRNMSRLRFLGLARYTEAHSGRWFITKRGYAFLRNEPIPAFVWIYRNKIVEDMRTDQTKTISEVFKNDVPYFEPVQDQQTTTPEERQVIVDDLTGQSMLFDVPKTEDVQHRMP